MARVIGLGAGGHAKVVLDIVAADGHEIVGLLDPDPTLYGASILGVAVVGTDELIPELMRNGVTHAFVGLGSTGDVSRRRRLYELACEAGLEVLTVVHRAAIVARSARLGHGATVMAGAVINADASLGANVIVNTSAVVEHDCILGDHVHIATGARLGGSVEVGEGGHIGIGASVNQSLRIGAGSIVGAGAAVIADVEAGIVVAGVPARMLRQVASP